MPRHPYGIFEDMDQAVQHIRYRYLLYGGRAYNCTNIQFPNDPDDDEAVARVVLQDKMGNRREVDIDDPEFNNYRFDPLGWINHESGPVLADLRPIRQTRRGYGDENVIMWELSRFGDGLDRHHNLTVTDLMFDDGFNEMLVGEYPALPEVAQRLFAEPNMSIAVSRDFLMQSDEDGYLWLWRGGYRIGLFTGMLDIQLGNRFKYLREELDESPIFNRHGVLVR